MVEFNWREPMYEPLLFVHSWTRWIILITLVGIFLRMTYGWIRNKEWTPLDQHLLSAFTQLFGTQILIGLFIWLSLSPIVKLGFKNPDLFWSDPVVSFWGFRHTLTMILTMIIVQVFISKSKPWSDLKKFRTFSLVFGVFIVVVCSAIPWPGLVYGRTLFRWWSW